MRQDVQDDEQPDGWWDDALYVEDSDDSEYWNVQLWRVAWSFIYFSDTEAVEACICRLNVMWCDDDDAIYQWFSNVNVPYS